MTTLLEPTVARSLPTIRRESISWRTEGAMVYIDIELANNSWEQTTEDTLVIEAAPFGAFIPNVPITSIAVGSLDPGERRIETIAVRRDVLDRFNQPMQNLAQRLVQRFDVQIDPAAHVHWIGNLNVYFESQADRAVERHCAFNLRVPCGSKVVAMFMIQDALDLTFDVFASDDEWTGEVTNDWSFALLLVDAPNEAGKRAHVTVDVKRNSDGKIVPVEFDFETVEGWGETLGCVRV